MERHREGAWRGCENRKIDFTVSEFCDVDCESKIPRQSSG
jgi:hypothetical protein